MVQIALYGKGGIGKSTIAANLAAALALNGLRVLQIGCDPKHDSTRLLLGGITPPTVLDYIRDTPPSAYDAHAIMRTGVFGVQCIEAGGPEPGIGCAGRGILTTFELLDRLGIRDQGHDVVFYDVLGDVVCGGFAVPIRAEYADRVYLVTSGEFMALYAANNILRGLKNYETGAGRVGGLIMNARGGTFEDGRVERFAAAVGLPILERIPRDDAFAAAERANECLLAYAPTTPLAARLQVLAASMITQETLYPAQPLTDEDLEEQVLERKTGVPAPRLTATSTPTPATPVVPTSTSATTPSDTLMSKALVFKEPLHGCAFNGALSVTTQLADCVTLVHGPQSCAHIAFQTMTSLSRRSLLERGIVTPLQTAPPVVCTDMNESVMVFGGKTQLQERIEQLKRRHPPVIFVISTCPSGIIGENIELVRTLGDEHTRVIPLSADGNLTGDHLQGVFQAYQSIAEELIDRTVAPEQNLVNIIAEKTIATATPGNLDFATEVLSRLGLRVNCRFLCESSFDAVRGFMKAPLNLLAVGDYMGTTLQAYLEKQFSSRFFARPFPIGFSESCEWVSALAVHYGRTEVAPDIINTFRQRYDALLEQLRPQLAGRRLMVVTFSHNIDWILSCALDLGMKLAFVGILNYSQDHLFTSAFTEHIEELHTNLDYDSLMRSHDVQRVAPDVLLGNYLSGEEMNVKVTDTIPLCPNAGFLSGIQMAARWADLARRDLGEGWRRDRDLYRKHLS
jgi:nitrogenase iron protein